MSVCIHHNTNLVGKMNNIEINCHRVLNRGVMQQRAVISSTAEALARELLRTRLGFQDTQSTLIKVVEGSLTSGG